MKIGFVVTELLDGRFVPWTRVLEWESYLDLYCLALQRRGHQCVKYVPSIGVRRTETYRHKFGHEVKRVPAYNKVIAPAALLRTRSYESGYTSIFRQLLGPAFTLHLMRETKKDDVQLLHYSSYYSNFFVPSPALRFAVPFVVQYSGGELPSGDLTRLFWRMALISSLHFARAVLVGDYRTETRTLTNELCVPRKKLTNFNAPIIDRDIFRPSDKEAAQRGLGFDARRKNVLCVTYVPRKHSAFLGKDPYLMVDLVAHAIKSKGADISLHIVGWGAGEGELRDHVDAIGLGGAVRFLGRVDHDRLSAYYSACDIVFVPYRMERLNEGSATIEAFACGRPVVAFKRRPSDISDQEGGFLVDDDPQRGGNSLLEHLARPGYLETKGVEGASLSDHFSLEFAGKRLEEIYERALGIL